MPEERSTPWLLGRCPRCDSRLQPGEDARLNLWKLCRLCGWEALFRPANSNDEQGKKIDRDWTQRE